MPSARFQFKQFSIVQDRCAMKVGTDGVLLGAWADVSGCGRILDLGTGTGLLALMAAQRTSMTWIDAVEVDEDASNQAHENTERSPWAPRIRVFHQSWLDFVQSTTTRYDLILSNPPFFTNSSKSHTQAKRLARHDDHLSYEDILQGAEALLHAQGRLALVYPPEEASRFCERALESGWFVRRRLHVFSVPYKPIRRILFECCREPQGETLEESLVIESGQRHDYTDAYRALTRDFYLKF